MHVIATAGHVDHGKTTLLRQLTGMEPDRWEQERDRGMTIDLGFAWTTLGARTLAFVDVPGHERFVPNMLAGAGTAPAALFVVAADEGWQPQSDEHLAALHALGVRHALLAITRSDLADPTDTETKALQNLAGTTLADPPVVQVSGRTGAGLPALRTALAELTDSLPTPDTTGPVRLWIDRAFTIRGAGTVVTGTLTAGTLRTGDRLRLHPADQDVVIRGLHTLGEPRTHVTATARVAVNLRGIPHRQVRRGHALLTEHGGHRSDLVDVRLPETTAADLPRHLVLHLGSAAVPVRIRPLGTRTARLSLAAPLPMRIGDRVLLRDPGGHHIHGADLLDVRPRPLRRRGAARDRARELDTIPTRPDGTTAPDGAAELRRRKLIRHHDLRAMGAEPPADAPTAAGWLLDPAHRDTLAEHLVHLLHEHRHQHPLDAGMSLEAARRALDLPDPALLEPLLRTPTTRDVHRADGRLRLGTAPWPPEVAAALRALHDTLRADPFTAPTADELHDLGLGPAALAAAARAGELLRLAPGIVLSAGADQHACDVLATLPQPFTPADARRALRTTRRVALPLLELLARDGRTERLPDGTHRLR